jgi:hypothetical protein
MKTFMIFLKGNNEEVKNNNWYARLDLNQRSSAPEADALSPGPRAQKHFKHKLQQDVYQLMLG